MFAVNWSLLSTGINLREACEKQAASINNATDKRATTTEHGSSEDAIEPTLSVTQRIPMKQVLSLETEQVNTPVPTIFSEKFLSYIMRLWIFFIMISPKGKQGRRSVRFWRGADRVVFNQVSKVIRQLGKWLKLLESNRTHQATK